MISDCFKPYLLAASWIAFLLLSWNNTALALDPHKAITQYVHNVWQIEDGLPQGSITAIAQTPDRYLWFATAEGLARFDGVSFTVFNKTNTEELKDNSITALLVSRDGSLWIGTQEGSLSRYKEGRFISYTNQNELSDYLVFSILEDQQGNIWIGTSGGLFRLKDKNFKAYKIADDIFNDSHFANSIISIYEDSQGKLLVSTYGGGLYQLKDERFTKYKSIWNQAEGNAAGSVIDEIVSFVKETRDGSLWIGGISGAQGGTLTRIKNGQRTTYTVKDGLPKSRLLTAVEDRDGNLWIGSRGDGLIRLRDGKITTYSTPNGLSGDTVWSVYEDREGNLWVGTTSGLNMFKDGAFTTYGTEEGLSYNSTEAVYQDNEGTIWISTNKHGLNRFRDGKFTVYTTKDGMASDFVLSMCGGRDRTLWLGTAIGLNRFKDGRFTLYTFQGSPSRNIVTALYEDREGTLWVGTEGGLNSFKDGKFTAYTRTQGLYDRRITWISPSREGGLWIGTDHGLYRFKNGVSTYYTKREGLSNDLITSLYEDNEGSLWISTHYGLNRFRDGKFTPYWSSQGLASDLIFLILEDTEDNLWMSCNKGIFRVSKKNLEALDRGESSIIASTLYGKTDGMRSVQAAGFRQPTGLKSTDGRLWFPTDKGVVVVDPAKLKVNELPPSVIIEKLYFDKKAIETRSNIELRPGDGELEFHYTGLSFVAPEKVLFKYKLEGFDKDWVDAGTRRVAHYTNIPPGSYRFRVIASNDDGVWNEEGAEVAFNLQPYFHQTRWFYALCILAVLLLAVGLYILRVRRLKHRTLELEKEVANRTVDLAQLNAELERATQAKSEFLANMSHEIRTPMNAVIGMTGLLLNTKLTHEQLDFVETLRSSSDALLTLINDILDFSKIESGKLDLEQQPFYLRDLIEEVLDLFAIQVGEKGIDLAYIIGHETPQIIVGDRIRLRQILVNLVGNAVKFTDSGEVIVSADARHLSAAADGSEFRFSVRDTGIGIPADRRDRLFHSFSQIDSSTTRRYGGTGLGLAISLRLSKLLGGEMWVESEPGQGSTFYFTVKALSINNEEQNSYLDREQPLFTGKRLLLVEDGDTQRTILTRQLERWGVSVEAASSGDEALSWVGEGRSFEIALIDMQTPEMDGLTLAQKIRQHPRADRIALILLSSVSRQEVNSLAAQAGINTYLIKPVKVSHLYEALLAALSGQPGRVSLPADRSKLNSQLGVLLPLKILLADDNVVNQKVALHILARMGYRADVAANGVEILEAVRSKHYDVVLTDVHMPLMDGLEAARRICNEFPPEQRPRIIAMTASAMQEDREQCFAAGMDDFVTKPFGIEELQAVLTRWGKTFKETSELPPSHYSVSGRQVAVRLSEVASDKIINLNRLLKLREMQEEGEDDIVEQLVKLFLLDAVQHLSALRLALVGADAETSRREAHALMGSCSTIGASQMMALAAELEQLSRVRDLDNARLVLEQLVGEYQRVCDTLSAVTEFETVK